MSVGQRDKGSFLKRRALAFLEDAYISSRYLPRTFSREVAERALALSERLLEVFSWLEGT